MTNIAKKISWLAPLALFVSLPASAIHIEIEATGGNPDFSIDNYFVEVDEETGLAEEFEIIESWGSVDPYVATKLITINFDEGPAPADPTNFEFEFKVTNNSGVNWGSYSFTFPDLALDHVLVGWENELFDEDDLPTPFSISEIDGNTLIFSKGAGDLGHLNGDMVSYELFFDLTAINPNQSGITEIAAVQAVPLPAAVWLMIGGLGMLVGFAKKRKTV